MSRIIVPAAEEMIGKEFKCLNHGHVTLIDYMGGDASVTQAARVSYAGDKNTFDPVKDGGLIRYLMSHRHTTPFEMVQIKVRMKLPLFVARQWVRHRTASLNEVSGRYTQLPDDFYIPEPENVQHQSTDNKQGRSGQMEDAQVHIDHLLEEQQAAYQDYETRIEAGMAKELSRINLPVSIYTEWYWNQNLHNMLHLLGLRMDSHAQYEIRVFADALYEIVKAVAPLSCEAWEEFGFHAKRFSRSEMEIVRNSMNPGGTGTWNREELKKDLGSDRAVDEFLAKIGKA